MEEEVIRMEDVVLYEKKEKVAILTINRPQALNALGTEVNLKIIENLLKAENDNEVRVIIITGAGNKAFIAGGDLKEMFTKDPLGARAFALGAKKVIDTILAVGKPVIAAINGLCLGGGMEYAMACDLRTAADTAKFGQPEINVGIMPGSNGTARLARYIGMAKAKEFCLTGEMFDAKQALELGLLNYVYPAASLLDETIALANKIAAKSAPAVRLIKAAMNHATEVDIESAAQFEIDCFALCFSTQEKNELMGKFVGKGK